MVLEVIEYIVVDTLFIVNITYNLFYFDMISSHQTMAVFFVKPEVECPKYLDFKIIHRLSTSNHNVYCVFFKFIFINQYANNIFCLFLPILFPFVCVLVIFSFVYCFKLFICYSFKMSD